MKTLREVRIPASPKRDARLAKLAKDCGFLSANRLLAHVAHEVARCKTPAELYHGLGNLRDVTAR